MTWTRGLWDGRQWIELIRRLHKRDVRNTVTWKLGFGEKGKYQPYEVERHWLEQFAIIPASVLEFRSEKTTEVGTAGTGSCFNWYTSWRLSCKSIEGKHRCHEGDEWSLWQRAMKKGSKEWKRSVISKRGLAVSVQGMTERFQKDPGKMCHC